MRGRVRSVAVTAAAVVLLLAAPALAGPVSMQASSPAGLPRSAGSPTVTIASFRVTVPKGATKAAVGATVDYRFTSGLRPVSLTVVARIGYRIVAEGLDQVWLEPGNYEVIATATYDTDTGRAYEEARRWVKVLPSPDAGRPRGAARSIGVPAYFDTELAYLFNSSGVFPTIIGANTVVARWPSRLDLGDSVYFDALRWKAWTRQGAVATGIMGANGQERKARLFFDSPQTFTCRHTSIYSSTTKVRLYGRFGWRGGHPHVRLGERWFNHKRWYLLESPAEVHRFNSASVFEC